MKIYGIVYIITSLLFFQQLSCAVSSHESASSEKFVVQTLQKTIVYKMLHTMEAQAYHANFTSCMHISTDDTLQETTAAI